MLHYIHHKYNKEHTLSPFAGLAFHPLDGILQVRMHSFSVIHQFVQACVHSSLLLSIHLFGHSFIPPSVHSLAHLLIHSYIHPFMTSFVFCWLNRSVCSSVFAVKLILH